MPWKITSLFGERLRFVRAVLKRIDSVAQLCVRFKISQKTGFKWLRRYQQAGGPGLRNRSRRPWHSPQRMARRWQRAIARLRGQRPNWGAKKIRSRLRSDHPRAALPCVRTIHRCLQWLGLTRRRRVSSRRGPQLPRPVLSQPQAPNDVWTVDFKGWFRTRDGQRVDPLTVRDLFSRYLLGIRLLSHRHVLVRQYFQRLFTRYGKPRIIRVDHGSPFAGDGALDLSRLSAWWLRLGIRVEFTGRARPQDNAAHEQMHRIYQADLVSPPAATPRAQQWCTTRWITYYNYERPHEGLGQRVPAALYRKSRRRVPVRLPELRYPRAWPTRRVTDSGYVRWHGRLRVIGRAFGRERVGFKPAAAGYEVYFGSYLIGLLVDTDPGGLRVARWSKAPNQTHKP